jgi:hypothetical protein
MFLAVFNPFASQPAPQSMPPQQQQPDLVNFFDAPAQSGMQGQGPPPQASGSNPFAAFGAPAPIQTQAPGKFRKTIEQK